MKRILKIIAIIIGVIVIIGAIAFGAALFFTASDRQIAKQFTIDLSTGEFERALAVLHPEVAREFPIERMEQVFADAIPYAKVKFSNIQASGGRTGLSGTASTTQGCTSEVSFTLLADQISAFNITPLCRTP